MSEEYTRIRLIGSFVIKRGFRIGASGTDRGYVERLGSFV
jgi:hypothetical protein